jgi:dTDP-4-dehydrorhamnose 3,5-epimerase
MFLRVLKTKKMNFIPTNALDCYSIEPKVIYDERGYFMESFNEKSFQEGVGQNVYFVQDNQSFSTKGVLRGLHYQTGEHAQAKLVRVIDGEVLDIVVDIRPNSQTYGEKVSIVLSAENKKQLFIPRGFAHGFVVLSETATFFYKCDNFYNKESEGGILYNDPEINIDWQFSEHELIVSEKDRVLPTLKNAKKVW